MKSIHVDYSDPDNRKITIVSDDGDEEVIEVDDGTQTVTIDGEEFEITKSTNDIEISANGSTGFIMACLGLFICGSALYGGWRFAGWVIDIVSSFFGG